MSTTRPSLLARLLMALVTLYQRVGFVRAPRCRFHPTCSNYALEALTLHGARRGSWLAARRILRCHPFHAGGVDHVPGHDAGDDAPADDRPGIPASTSIDPASRDAVVA